MANEKPEGLSLEEQFKQVVNQKKREYRIAWLGFFTYILICTLPVLICAFIVAQLIKGVIHDVEDWNLQFPIDLSIHIGRK